MNKKINLLLPYNSEFSLEEKKDKVFDVTSLRIKRDNKTQKFQISILNHKEVLWSIFSKSMVFKMIHKNGLFSFELYVDEKKILSIKSNAEIDSIDSKSYARTIKI